MYPGPDTPGGVPLIKVGDIKDGTIPATPTYGISETTNREYKRTQLEGDELLITLVGSPGACVVVKPWMAGWNPARAIAVMRLKDVSLRTYVKAVLESAAGRHLIDAVLNTTVQKTLNLKDVRKLPIPLPPDSTVKGISALSEALTDRIALLRETNVTLEAIAQALFRSWFVDFDPVRAKRDGRVPEGIDEATAAAFPDGFEESELGPVPRGWTVGTVGQIAQVVDCLHAKKPELLAQGRPYLQLSSIRDDGLLDMAKAESVSEQDYLKWVARIEVREGDCLITNVGRVGAVAQVPPGVRAAMGRNMTAIRMLNDQPYPTYLIELLQSSFMRGEIERRTDVGTILNALNVRNIPLLRCVLPTDDLLRAFETVCRPLRAAMEANLKRATSLIEVRDALLPGLIEGRLRFPGAAELTKRAA
jgi:type I restriction enzyme S subunit